MTFLYISKENRFMWKRNFKKYLPDKALKRLMFFCCHSLYYLHNIFKKKGENSYPSYICQRYFFHFSHLYGSNRSWMSLKDCNWCTSSKTPHSYNLITAACSNKSVFIVNSHVRNFSGVPSKCSKEASIVCCPNFHQTVIWTLL